MSWRAFRDSKRSNFKKLCTHRRHELDVLNILICLCASLAPQNDHFDKSELRVRLLALHQHRLVVFLMSDIPLRLNFMSLFLSLA